MKKEITKIMRQVTGTSKGVTFTKEDLQILGNPENGEELNISREFRKEVKK